MATGQGRPAVWPDIIRAEAQAAGVNPAVALAVAEHESGFDPTKLGSIDEIGIMQLRPGTAKLLGVDPTDPIQNIRGGIKYLKQQLDAHNQNVGLALGAYNAGPDGIPNPEYVHAVLGRMPKYLVSAQTGPPAPSAVSGAPTTPAVSHDQSPPVFTHPKARMGQMLIDTAKAVASGFDPRTAQGQRNLAGAGTAGAIGLATGGVGIVPAAAMVLGAGAAGAATDVAQQVYHGARNPFTDITLPSVVGAGFEQAGQEALGQLGGGAFKAVARRALGPPVSKAAQKALETQRATMEAQLDEAVRATQDAFQATKYLGQIGIEQARATADTITDSAKATAADRLAQVRRQLPAAGPGVTPTQVGRMTHQVVEGPVASVKDRLGKAVGETAKAGPEIPAAPLRERLAELSEQITPFASHEAGGPPAPAINATYKKTFGTDAPHIPPGDKLASLQKLNVPIALDAGHPLPGTLARIEEALAGRETIPFEDAHKIKRLLDDAVNWTSPAKRQVQQITKGFRGTLRDLMAAHEPYNQATGAYERLSKLYGSTLPKQLRRAALDNPGSLVGMVKGKEPLRLQMLKDLLLHEAPKGGGEAEGQAAWESLRAVWTHEKLVKGGPERLLDRIGKLDPDFVGVMYGDRQGQQALDNLRQIGQAYADAEARNAAEITAAKRTSKGVVRSAITDAATAQRTAKGAVSAATAARQAGRAPTPAEEAFKASSLHGISSLEQVGGDVLLAGARGPASVWGARSIVRLITHGPKAADLITWAEYSPARTRALVHLVNSPFPAEALADFIRATGWVDKDLIAPAVSHDQGPPRPAALSR